LLTEFKNINMIQNMQNIKNSAVAQIDEGILYKQEIRPNPAGFESLTAGARNCLSACNLSGFQTGTALVILHEFLESLSRLILDNPVTVVLKKTAGEILQIKVHIPLSHAGQDPEETIGESIRKVNMHDDLDALFVDTMERPRSGEKDNTFRYSLVRKLAQGALITWNRSTVYVPGMVISVPFPLA
jgi:hypothetical protein